MGTGGTAGSGAVDAGAAGAGGGASDAGVDSGPPGNPDVVYVDINAKGANDGTSWANAFTSIDSAVPAAQGDGGTLKQIWIAQGTYRASSANATVLTMVPNLKVYGGFLGTEASLSDRPANPTGTILDGDYNNDDATLDLQTVYNDYKNSTTEPTRSDNASVVVELAAGIVLDGVSVTGGYAAATQYGIGIQAPANSTGFTLTNLDVYGNIGGGMNGNGAGLGVLGHSSGVLTDSTFHDNIGWDGGGIRTSKANLTVQRVVFQNNATFGGGGAGLYQYNGQVTVEDSRFLSNTSSGNLGGVYVGNSGTATLSNVLFDGNVGNNAAVSAINSGTFTLVNATVANSLPSGRQGAIGSTGTTVVNVENSAFWNNASGDIDTSGNPLVVSYSCGPDVPSGSNNVVLDASTNPLGNPFVTGPNGELFLANTAAGDSYTSACVDSGDNTTANADFPNWKTETTRKDGVLDGANNDAVDMGFHYLP